MRWLSLGTMSQHGGSASSVESGTLLAVVEAFPYHSNMANSQQGEPLSGPVRGDGSYPTGDRLGSREEGTQAPIREDAWDIERRLRELAAIDAEQRAARERPSGHSVAADRYSGERGRRLAHEFAKFSPSGPSVDLVKRAPQPEPPIEADATPNALLPIKPAYEPSGQSVTNEGDKHMKPDNHEDPA